MCKWVHRRCFLWPRNGSMDGPKINLTNFRLLNLNGISCVIKETEFMNSWETDNNELGQQAVKIKGRSIYRNFVYTLLDTRRTKCPINLLNDSETAFVNYISQLICFLWWETFCFDEDEVCIPSRIQETTARVLK